MKRKPYILLLLLQFWASSSLATGHGGKSYAEISSWWRAIYPGIEQKIAKFNSHELEDLKKFRSSVKNLKQKGETLNKSFHRSLSIDHKLIADIEMYCNAVREITNLTAPIDGLLLSMELGLEYSAAVIYFYNNVKNKNGDRINDCDDTKWK